MSDTEAQREQQERAAIEAGTSAAAAGAMLRAAREAAGVHIAAMAVSLKVPVKKLEALEAGRLDLLPDAVFARGLAASICRGLKVDPQPVLDLLPANASSRIAVEPPAINAPFNAAGGESRASTQFKMSPSAIAVLVLLLGALVIYFLPASHKQNVGENNTSEPVASVPTPMENPAPNAPITGAGTAPVAAQAAASAPVAATAMATAVPGASAPVAAGAADGSQLLTFVARAETWVQVTDAKGVTPVRKTLQAGETVTASGTLPLAVVVGRIEAVDVQVRGKTMDLTPIAKNNVARFEVKQ